MVQRYETLSRHTIRLSPNTYVVPACSKMPLLYLLTQKVAQKFGSVLGIKLLRKSD